MKCLASLAGASSSHGSKNGSGGSGGCSGGGSVGAGLAVHFVGMVGGDSVAEEYERSIAAHGVAPLLLRHGPPGAPSRGAQGAAPAAAEHGGGAAAALPTATCLCLVTPDGQRTMRTSLGAALQLRQPEQLPPPLRGGAGGEAALQQAGEQRVDDSTQQSQQAAARGPWGLLHCEGYCLYRAEVAGAAMRAARAAGARVSLDLASFEVIHKCWARLDQLLQVRRGSSGRCAPAFHCAQPADLAGATRCARLSLGVARVPY